MATAVVLGALAMALLGCEVWSRVRMRRDQPRPQPLRAALALLALLGLGAALWTQPSENGFLAVVLVLPLQLLVVLARFFRHHRRRGRPASWRRLLFGNALLMALTFALLLLGGELWFRFGRDTTDSIGYTKVAQRWLQRHYRFNTATFRDDVEYAPAIAAGKRRISFVGDSFTAGHGIERVQDRFAGRLRARQPEWEVHVLAHNGADTVSETKLLELLGSNGYQFDEVVLVYCLNDVQDLLPHWTATLAAAASTAAQRPALFDSSWLLDTIYYRVAIQTLPGIGDYFSFLGEAYRGEPWQQQQQRLQALQQVVERHGGRLTVVTWPFLQRLGADYPQAAAHTALAEFWQRQGVPHLDLLPLLRDERPATLVVNAADAHPNAHASELAAAAIERWLGPLLAARPRR
ncbi:MAG: GDSL-type esterase/lipase family protein [Planctomycetes bacterium]|jgi:lysophospholipase L1-like esterase|nr:GDSL-type esterase/lipase family protein [Planctomycetota bacterium]